MGAIKYFHGEKVVHRDLKNENVMLSGNLSDDDDESDINIKIIDFGLSKITLKDNKIRLTTNCGSLIFSSPEIV